MPIDIKDRIFAALTYSIPLYFSFSLGQLALGYLPQPLVVLIEIFLTPLGIVYSILPFADLVIFFVIFGLIVQNQNISHFIRFNAMQALLVDIILILLRMGIGILSFGMAPAFLGSIIFIATLAICIYSIIQCSTGKYPEIPGIAETAYSQVP